MGGRIGYSAATGIMVVLLSWFEAWRRAVVGTAPVRSPTICGPTPGSARLPAARHGGDDATVPHGRSRSHSAARLAAVASCWFRSGVTPASAPLPVASVPIASARLPKRSRLRLTSA